MLFIAENLKVHRKEMGLTQEDVATMLCVTPQSVSKWERGETYPDITLLPALANLFKTSVDALIGMDKIHCLETRNDIFKREHEFLRTGDYISAAAVLDHSLKTFPNDESLMSELALTLAFSSDPQKLRQSALLCERVLSGNPTEKVRHTTRAAMCFIYLKSGDREKAMASARNLPHMRESREAMLAQMSHEMTQAEIDDCLRFIVLGDTDAETDVHVV